MSNKLTHSGTDKKRNNPALPGKQLKLPLAQEKVQDDGFLKANEVNDPIPLLHSSGMLSPNLNPVQKVKMAISENGINLIKRFEGYRKFLYNDPVGHCTIGYGTLVHKGLCNGSEPQDFKLGVSEKRATELLVEKVMVFANAIHLYVQVPLNQNQFDALVSFVYNVGTGAFRQSTLLKELNKGNYGRVPFELRKWVKAGGHVLPGLVKRRDAEAALYLKKEEL